MAGRPAFDRETYAEDIADLRRRGMTYQEVAEELGMSRVSLWRIVRETSQKAANK